LNAPGAFVPFVVKDKTMEFHPRINIHNPQLKASRIILGSFPTYPYTFKSEEDAIQSAEKQDLSFFYGSERNQFWNWYRDYVDETTDKSSVQSLRKSLEKHGIGITDTIYSCIRKGHSALDAHLTQRVYNYNFFHKPAKGEILKILCTSKGVMNEMLLTDAFFRHHPDLSVDKAASEEREREIMKAVHGKLVHKPIFRVLQMKDGGSIECAALPSPGSPVRSLRTFGFQSGNAGDYLNRYLKLTFKWFLQ
jgi:hypothetical protein